MDADVIVVGAGLAGLVAAARARPAGAGRSPCSTRRTRPTSAARRSGPSAASSWSTPPNSAASASRTPSTWPGTTGRAAPASTGPRTRTPGRCAGPGPTSSSRRGRSGPGCAGTASSFLPTVGWAERGDLRAGGHGNSVPRFHIAWGTGTGVVEPFVRYAQQAARDGLLTFHHRHRVDELVVEDGTARGVRGTVLAADDSPRGVASNRDAAGEFELTAQAVVLTTGGIGADHDIVRAHWPERLGTPPADMVTGVPAYVDGRMLDISAEAGVRLVNRDRMWHYTEGLRNWDPIWPGHGIRILPGPSSIWFDALGRRLPDPCLPGYDTLGTLRHLRTTDGHRRATTTPGSSSPRRSSRRSSRSPAPSRTPTSPPRTARRCCGTGCSARAPRPRCEAFLRQGRGLRDRRHAGANWSAG